MEGKFFFLKLVDLYKLHRFHDTRRYERTFVEDAQRHPRNVALDGGSSQEDHSSPSPSTTLSSFSPESDWQSLFTEWQRFRVLRFVHLHGLCGEDRGAREGAPIRFTPVEIDRLVNKGWPSLGHFYRNYYLISPQPERRGRGQELHILVEFLNPDDIPHPALCPVLEEVHLWTAKGNRELIRQTAYHHAEVTGEGLFHGFGKWCDSTTNYRCDAWLRDKPLELEQTVQLHPGDHVTLRISSRKLVISNGLEKVFTNAQDFFATAQDASAKAVLNQHVFWSIHTCSEGDAPTNLKVPWAVAQSPWEVVNFLALHLHGKWNFEVCFSRVDSSPSHYHFVLQNAGQTTRPVLFSVDLRKKGVLCEKQCKGASVHPTADLNDILRHGGFSGWFSSPEIDIGLTLKHPDGREFEWEDAHLFTGGQQVHLDINVKSVAGLASNILSYFDEQWDQKFMEDTPEVSLLQTQINLKVDGSKWQTDLARNASTDQTVQEATLRKVLLSLEKWPDTAFSNCWEQIPDAHPYVSLIRKLQPAMSGVGALHVFTDGSYYKSSGSGAWAFSVVLQLNNGQYYRWGYTGALIEGCASSLEAEAIATAHALFWLLSNMADTRYPVTIHGDATSVGFGANGDFNEPQVSEFRKLHLRSLFQLCHTVLGQLDFRHVPAHAGQIDNELVDSVAKALAQQQWSPFTGIPSVQGILNCPLIDWAWLLVEKEVIGNEEYPSLNSLLEGTGFPELPAAMTTVFPQSCEVQSAEEEIRLALRIFSANVRTLKGVAADPTFSDKADLLAKQLSDLDVDIVALQETRSRASAMSQRHGYICLSAQAKAGRGGIEIWLNQHGRLSSSVFGPIQREHCHVWHSDHTLLCLECDHPLLACDIVAVYAPQSSLAAEQIDDWWSNLAQLLAVRGRKDTILLGDCNAKVGSVESSEIGPVGWTIEDRAGSHLRNLLADRSLILPSTFSCWHNGPTSTFHGPAGGAVRLDYIALPWDWQHGFKSSAVSEVDLLNGVYDHSGVEVHLELKVTPKSSTVKQHRACYNREEARRNPETLAHIVSTLPMVATTADVDTHWHTIATYCQANLQYHFPKPKRIKRQIYFSDRTWTILNDRKDTQKDLRSLDRQESRLLLSRWFGAWKKKPLDCQENNPVVALGTIRQEKAFLLWVRAQQKEKPYKVGVGFFKVGVHLDVLMSTLSH